MIENEINKKGKQQDEKTIKHTEFLVDDRSIAGVAAIVRHVLGISFLKIEILLL